ncbi:FAD-binding oxidoreductase [Nocardioides conyzicola]|uniref:FAD-binding oxidoreductase n=1 Tax=Nocardioides conyzicola TaxID=1651781 RepID=A0ABP8XAN4_9ACTN
MVIGREEAGFEEARVDRIFNRRLPDRRPAAVVRPTTEAEVVDAVRLARERGWQVAVRSGGHSWAQWSVRTDALVIDLGGLQEMELDEETGIVRVSPSTKGGAELAPYLAERGRFFLGGHCPTVGVGGFLLQGGQGWNARGWGWAAEYVVAVDVVTADGALVHASADENADLYWAARGSGPGFPGLVTRFHLQTRPLPRHFAHTVQGFRLEDFDDVMTWLHDTHHTVADTVEIVALTKTDSTLGPDPILLVTALAMVDDEAEAERALAPFRGNPALDRAIFVIDNQPTTPEAERTRQLEDNPEGHRWAVDNAWLSGSAAEVVPAMRRAYTTLPNAKAFTIWFSMAPLRELPDMAFSLQSEIYLASYVLWESPEDDERCISWLEGAMADLEPVTVGQYLGDSDHTRRQVRFMSDDAWARLQQVYADRDPDRLFVGYLGESANRNHWS